MEVKDGIERHRDAWLLCLDGFHHLVHLAITMPIDPSIACETCRIAGQSPKSRAEHYHCKECGKRAIRRHLELYRQHGGEDVVEQIKNELYDEWTRGGVMNKEQQEAALKLASWLLNPDGGGYSVGPWERDLARLVVGLKPVECVIKTKPRIKWIGGAWICSTNGIVGYPGKTEMEAYKNWLFDQGGRA